MVTTFNKSDLLSFGTYVKSEKREVLIKRRKAKECSESQLQESLSRVTHQDIDDWKEGNIKNPSTLLGEFFNSSSDANKYLEASQQEDLETEFGNWLNGQN